MALARLFGAVLPAAAGRPGFFGQLLRFLCWAPLWVVGWFRGFRPVSGLLGLSFLVTRAYRRPVSKILPRNLAPEPTRQLTDMSQPLPYFGSRRLMYSFPEGLRPANRLSLGRLPLRWLARRPGLWSILIAVPGRESQLARLKAGSLAADLRRSQRWLERWEVKFYARLVVSVRLRLSVHLLALGGGQWPTARPSLYGLIRLLDLHHTILWYPKQGVDVTDPELHFPDSSSLSAGARMDEVAPGDELAWIRSAASRPFQLWGSYYAYCGSVWTTERQVHLDLDWTDRWGLGLHRKFLRRAMSGFTPAVPARTFFWDPGPFAWAFRGAELDRAPWFRFRSHVRLHRLARWLFRLVGFTLSPWLVFSGFAPAWLERPVPRRGPGVARVREPFAPAPRGILQRPPWMFGLGAVVLLTLPARIHLALVQLCRRAFWAQCYPRFAIFIFFMVTAWLWFSDLVAAVARLPAVVLISALGGTLMPAVGSAAYPLVYQPLGFAGLGPVEFAAWAGPWASGAVSLYWFAGIGSPFLDVPLLTWLSSAWFGLACLVGWLVIPPLSVLFFCLVAAALVLGHAFPVWVFWRLAELIGCAIPSTVRLLLEGPGPVAPLRMGRVRALGSGGSRSEPPAASVLGFVLSGGGWAADSLCLWGQALPGAPRPSQTCFFVSPVSLGRGKLPALPRLGFTSPAVSRWLPIELSTRLRGSLMSSGYYRGPTERFGHGLARQGLISYPGSDWPGHLQGPAYGFVRSAAGLVSSRFGLASFLDHREGRDPGPGRRLLAAFSPSRVPGGSFTGWPELGKIDGFFLRTANLGEVGGHAIGQDMRSWGLVRRLVDSLYVLESQAVLSSLRLDYCSKLSDLARLSASSAEVSCFPGHGHQNFDPDCVPAIPALTGRFPGASLQLQTLANFSGPDDFRSYPAGSDIRLFRDLVPGLIHGLRQPISPSAPEDYHDLYYLEQPSHWFLDETLTGFDPRGLADPGASEPYASRSGPGGQEPPPDLRRISFLDIIRMKRGLPRTARSPGLESTGQPNLPARDMSDLIRLAKEAALSQLGRIYPAKATAGLSKAASRPRDMAGLYGQATIPRLVSSPDASYLRRLATPGSQLFFLPSRWYVLWPWAAVSLLAKFFLLLARPLLVFLLISFDLLVIFIFTPVAGVLLRLMSVLLLHAVFLSRAAVHWVRELLWFSFVRRSYNSFYGQLRRVGRPRRFRLAWLPGLMDSVAVDLHIAAGGFFCHYLLFPLSSTLKRLLFFLGEAKPGSERSLGLVRKTRARGAPVGGQKAGLAERQFVLWYLVIGRLTRKTLGEHRPVLASSDGQRLRFLLSDWGVAASWPTPEGLRLIAPSVRWDQFKALGLPRLRPLPSQPVGFLAFEAEVRPLRNAGSVAARLALLVGWPSVASGALCLTIGFFYCDWYTIVLFLTGSDWLRLYSYLPAYVPYVFWLATWLLATALAVAVARRIFGDWSPGLADWPAFGTSFRPRATFYDLPSTILMDHEYPSPWDQLEEDDEPMVLAAPKEKEEAEPASTLAYLAEECGEAHPSSPLEFDDYNWLEFQRSVLGFGLSEFDPAWYPTTTASKAVDPGSDRLGFRRLVGDLLLSLMPRNSFGNFYWPAEAGNLSPDPIRPMLSEDPFSLASFLEFADATMLLPAESNPSRRILRAEPVPVPWLLVGPVLLFWSVGSDLFTRPTPRHSREFATYSSFIQGPYPRAGQAGPGKAFSSLRYTPGTRFPSRLPPRRHGIPPLALPGSDLARWEHLQPKFGEFSYQTGDGPSAMAWGYRYPVGLVPYYPLRQEIKRVRLGMFSKVRASRRLRSWSLKARHKQDYRRSSLGSNFLRYPLAESGLVPRRAKRSRRPSRLTIAHPAGGTSRWLPYTKLGSVSSEPLRPMPFKFPASYFKDLTTSPRHSFLVPRHDLDRSDPFQIESRTMLHRFSNYPWKKPPSSPQGTAMRGRLVRQKRVHRSFMLHWEMANGVGARLHKPRRLRSPVLRARRSYEVRRRRRLDRFNKRKSGQYLRNPHYFLEHLPSRVRHHKRRRWEFPRVRLNRPQFIFQADLRHYHFHPKKRFLQRIDTSWLRGFFPLLRDRYRIQPDWSIPVLEHRKLSRTRGYRRRAKALGLRELAGHRVAAAQESLGFQWSPPGPGPRGWKALRRRRRFQRQRTTKRTRYPANELLIRRKPGKRKPTMLDYRLGSRKRFKKSLAVLRGKASILRPDDHASTLFGDADVGLLSASRRYLPKTSSILPLDLRRLHARRPLGRLSQSVWASFHRHRRTASLFPREMEKRAFFYRATRRHRGFTHRTGAYLLPKPIVKLGTFKRTGNSMARRNRKYKTGTGATLHKSRRFLLVDRDHGVQLPAWRNRRPRRKKYRSLYGTAAFKRRRRRSRTMRTRRLEADVTDPISPAWPVPKRLAWRRHGAKKPKALEPEAPGQGENSLFSYSDLAGYWESASALADTPRAVPPKAAPGRGDLLFQTAPPLGARRLPNWTSGGKARRSRPSATYGQAAKGIFKSRGARGRRKINRYGSSSSLDSPRLGHALSLLPSILEQLLVGVASCWVELFYDFWWACSEVAALATLPGLYILPHWLAGLGALAWLALFLAERFSLMALDAAGALGFLADLASQLLDLVGWHRVSPSPYPAEKIARSLY